MEIWRFLSGHTASTVHCSKNIKMSNLLQGTALVDGGSKITVQAV